MVGEGVFMSCMTVLVGPYIIAFLRCRDRVPSGVSTDQDNIDYTEREAPVMCRESRRKRELHLVIELLRRKTCYGRQLQMKNVL